ncbi:ABC transporter permease [Alphaproteobacteria bacterium]|nr:ABC transporter permease [Alphaproteobacteria bacterium]
MSERGFGPSGDQQNTPLRGGISVIDWRTSISGGVLILLALIIAFLLDTPWENVSTFRISRPRDEWAVGNLVVPSQWFNVIAAVFLAFLGTRLFLKGGGRWTALFLGVGLVVLAITFLVWATSGKAISLTGMMQATVVRAVPIALAAVAGIMCERVAVINIAIEGMLLAGAFAGALFGSLLGGWAGIICAMMIGGLFGLLLAALVITYRVDQIIAGVVINLFVLGLTSYVSSQVFSEFRWLNKATPFRAFKVPVLGDIPLIGPVFFNQNLFVYGALILVTISTYYLFHTRHGLRARAVGEHPRAADTLGINVIKTRYAHVIVAGMVAGFGGAWFTLGSVGRFDENMTFGKGFIGLAAMIFGRWHPLGALAAALVFGFADSLQQKLSILNTPIPSEFLSMAPYIATIVVVAGLVGRARPPAAIGKPYVKD